MKLNKKFIALLLAVVMVFSFATAVSAANVTVPTELDGHIFTAYQIFTGTQATSEGPLGNVEWGNGINSEKFLAALKSDATLNAIFGSCTTAKDVAAKLGNVADNSDTAKAVAKLAYANKTYTKTTLESGNNDLATGYYLIVDESGNLNDGDYALNKALLQVTGNINIGLKTDKPSVEKKIKEDDKYNQDGGYGNGYNDVADYNIGDNVPFELIATVPNMTEYDTYKYIFHDTLSAGLTLNKDSIKVYVADDAKGTNKEGITNSWTISIPGTEDENECSFEVSVTNLKAVENVSAGKYIIVEYTATLNENAVIGLPGNENKVYLEYSNNPNQGGDGDTGKTPEDKVIVFTYELDVTKVDGNDNKALADAEFKLKNSDNKWATVNADGKVTGWVSDEAGATVLKSDGNGLFKVIGLDDGTYFLKETKAPDGYDLLTGEIKLVITATTANSQNWSGTASDALTALQIQVGDKTAVSGDTGSGTVGASIENNQGPELPETGGIGTTVFYVIGSILLIGAAVLLVVRRRMRTEK